MVGKYHGATQSHGFSINVFYDTAVGEFVAQLHTYSPPVWEHYVSGTQPESMTFGESEEIRDKDIEMLLNLARQRIAIGCGPILEFVVQ